MYERESIASIYNPISLKYLEISERDEDDHLYDLANAIIRVVEESIRIALDPTISIVEIRRRQRLDFAFIDELERFDKLRKSTVHVRDTTRTRMLDEIEYHENIILMEWESMVYCENVVRYFIVPWLMERIDAIREIDTEDFPAYTLNVYKDYNDALENGGDQDIMIFDFIAIHISISLDPAIQAINSIANQIGSGTKSRHSV